LPKEIYTSIARKYATWHLAMLRGTKKGLCSFVRVFAEVSAKMSYLLHIAELLNKVKLSLPTKQPNTLVVTFAV
jgi:hypothetical protein